ncbi:MAG: hypothetical protein N4A64_05965 [Marinisporobacter sp.]|jgi:hypothetical protein|nr:hypothetical protein [Marinisporobacter sp.]
MSYEPYMDLKYKIHKIRIDGKQKTLLLDKELDFWRKIYLIQDRIFLMELKNEEIISLKEEKANG